MRLDKIALTIFLIVLLSAHFFILPTLSLINKSLPHAGEVNIILPSPILKITSLDFEGLTSDILYLKAVVFYGSTFVGNSRRKISEQEFTWMHNTLVAATDLDPYFLDPYFLANGVLTWEANRIIETNKLLEKGSLYRNWDYWLPFFIGFNYFYFLGDNAKASDYLMQASLKPGADPFFGFFAARLAYQGKRTENAIIFLEGMLKTTVDESLRDEYELRLKALKLIQDLERGLAVYKVKHGVIPNNLSLLVEDRVIDRIPNDPYGGEFYIDKDGSVKTTSDMRYVVKK